MIRALLVAITIILVVGGIYFFKQYAQSPSGVAIQATPEPLVNAFHPDSALAFQWKTKSKTHAFVRENRNTAWRPEVNPQDVQERLNIIALADYQVVETRGSEIVSMIVAFGEKNQWEGAFDGKYYFWKTGSYAGKGFQVKAEHLKKFEAGSMAFANSSLDWCPARVRKLEVDAGPLKFTMHQQGLIWVVNKKEVDPTYIEKWLGRACSNQLEEYVDPATAPAEKYRFEGTIRAQFVNGKVLSWKKDLNEPAFQDGNRQFLSPLLAKHLTEVPEAPIKGDAPPDEPEIPAVQPKAAPPAKTKSK